MSKNIFTSALLVALAVGAQAQAPQLFRVKRIFDPNTTGQFLNGQALSGVSVVGNTMYYCGYGSSKATLVKVANWNGASPVTTQFFQDSLAVNGRPAKVSANSNFVIFSTSVGQNAANSGDTSGNQTEIYRLLPDGSNPSVGINNFVDGKLTAAELGFTSGVGVQDVKIDPGFGATPTPRIGIVRGDSRVFRLADFTTGNTSLIAPQSTPLNLYRGMDFLPNGDAYIKWQNNTASRMEVYKLVRQSETGSISTGFDAGTMIATSPLQGVQGQNILGVEAASGYSEFNMSNDASLNGTYTGSGTPGALVLSSDPAGVTTGYPIVGGAATTFGSVTPTLNLPFQSREVALGTAFVNGTQYIFMGNFEGTANVVEVLQVGNNGQISGNIAFSDLSGSAPTVRQATIILKEGAGTVLDTRVVTTDSSGNYSFITTVRGTVNVFVDAKHYLVKASNAGMNSGIANSGVNAVLINGDINDDNFVGFDDFDILSGAFGSSDTDPGYVAGADLNEDLFCGFDDFDILSANFGTGGDE